LIEVPGADDLLPVERNRRTTYALRTIVVSVDHHDLARGRPIVLEYFGKSLWPTGSANVLLGPKGTVIGAAGACKARTVEVSVTEESRNNRLDNKSLLFMGTSREDPGKPNSPAGDPRFPTDTDGQEVQPHKLRLLDQWRGERF